MLESECSFPLRLSFPTSLLTESINAALYICGGSAVLLTGLWTKPETNSSGPSEASVQLIAKKATCKHYWSLVWRSLSAHFLSNAVYNDSWLFSTVPIPPAVSISGYARLARNGYREAFSHSACLTFLGQPRVHQLEQSRTATTYVELLFVFLW